MASPYNVSRSKLNRAIAAYLITPGFNCGTAADISPANSPTLSTYPKTTVRSAIAKSEVQFVGDLRITVHISIKGSAVLPDGTTNIQIQREAFDDRCAATCDALMMSDNNQDLSYTAKAITAAGRALAVDASNGTDPNQVLLAQQNADMADFSVILWVDGGNGDGEADEESCAWEEILIFEAMVASSNVD